jgi:glucokinase-like ROK family protein
MLNNFAIRGASVDIAPPELSTPQAFAGAKTTDLRAHNTQAVLLTLFYHGPSSRARLAEMTGLSTTAMTNIVNELLQQGIAVEEGYESADAPRAGRPRIAVRLVPEQRYAVGAHLDVDLIRVAVLDLAGRVSHSLTEPRKSPANAVSDVMDETADLVNRVLAAAGILRERVVGAGVGVSGLVDFSSGINVVAPFFGWQNVPVRDLLAARLKLPVVVENNVRAMAFGESMLGAARSVNNMAFVFARVGVGAGLVFNGQVHRGSYAGAGEIGHTTVIPMGGVLCRCGNSGCLETLVSEPAILARARGIAGHEPNSALARALGDETLAPIERVFRAAQAGDVSTRALLREVSMYLGTALANLVNIINPDLIILGGHLALGQDMLLEPIRETMRKRAFGGLGRRVDVRAATFGPHAGVVGAAALAFDTFFYRQFSSASPVTTVAGNRMPAMPLRDPALQREEEVFSD